MAEKETPLITEAIIIAGGEGTRLRPLTDSRPKPMVLLDGEPIVSYQIRQMERIGIKDIIFACGYKHEVMEEEIGTGEHYGIRAKYSIEDTPLGRGGAIKKAGQLLRGDSEHVLVTNADNFWVIPLLELIRFHLDKNALATLTAINPKSPFGLMEADDNGSIIKFVEKPVMKDKWANAGIYVLRKDFLGEFPDKGDHETETFPRFLGRGLYEFKVGSEDPRYYWRGIDDKNNLEAAVKDLNNENLPLLKYFAEISSDKK